MKVTEMGLLRLCAIFMIILSNSMPVTKGQMLDWLNEPNSLVEIEKLVSSIKGLTNNQFSLMDFLQFPTDIFKFATDIFKFPKNISEACVDDVKYTLAELASAKTWSNVTNSWAVQMVDSIGKPPSGIMNGNLFWLGQFQQCLEVVAPKIEKSGEKFVGEYCLIKVHPKNLQVNFKNVEMNFNIGLCLPSTCSFEDKSLLTNYTLTLLKDRIEVTVEKNFCQTKHGKSMDRTTIVLTCIISTLCLLVVLGSLADLFTSMGNKNIEKIYQSRLGVTLLASFSAIRNVKAVFSISEKTEELGVISGLRVFSCYWIIVGHTMGYVVSQYPWKNQLEVVRHFDRFLTQPLSFNASFAVTTFFTISAFLVTYNFLKKSDERRQTPNVFWFYLYRYLRLTPPLIVLLLFVSGPCYHVNDGPLWPFISETVVNSCRVQWWKSILYVQNVFFSERDCLLEAWYLSADTQLYILSAVILYQLYKKPLVGVLLMGVCFTAPILFTANLIIQNNFPTYVGKGTDIQQFKRFYGMVYLHTFYHAPTYVIGMATGYLYYIMQKNRIPLNKKLINAGWISALTTMYTIVFGTFRYYNGSSVMGPWINIMYGCLARPAWGLAIAWVIFACALGHGGLLNWILTRPIFLTMGRLTYGVFLAHNTILANYFIGQHDGLYYSVFNVVSSTISNFVLTIIGALVVVVLIEGPTINILKQLGEKRNFDQPIVKRD